MKIIEFLKNKKVLFFQTPLIEDSADIEGIVGKMRRCVVFKLTVLIFFASVRAKHALSACARSLLVIASDTSTDPGIRFFSSAHCNSSSIRSIMP